ncbi:MAG: hypothetical protein JNM93_04955 [Bacteriovoracaceae bacterium]|nr:hypothetical protein [Bacteriovoracaceae bacterium]
MLSFELYHSLDQVDLDILFALEDFLKEKIPSLSWLQDYEKRNKSRGHFDYYLFFTHQQNTPVGFACIFLETQTRPLLKQKAFEFFNLEVPEKYIVYWKIPSITPIPYFFHPHHEQKGKESLQILFERYAEREDVEGQIFLAQKNFSFKHTNPSAFKVSEHVDYHLKYVETYHEYLASLELRTQSLIKRTWANLQKRKITLGEYPHFCESSHFKKPRIQELLQQPENEILQTWLKSNGMTLTFEFEGEVLGLIFLNYGKNTVFMNYIHIETLQAIEDYMYIQYALIKFYELPQFNKIHFFPGQQIKDVHPDFINSMALTTLTSQLVSTHTPSANTEHEFEQL